MKEQKLKIFISAYACEPGLGSEIGVGWHWVLEMSKYFDLWVLTRESNRHTIEPWMAQHPEYAGIRFLYFDLPKWARWWKKGLRGVRTYYNIWQVCTNRIVRRTMQENGIRVFHHLTYGNVLWKVSSYGQRQFFVWGPVGGLETVPEEFSRHYSGTSRRVEALRRLMASTLPLNIGLRNRCRRADLILCKTEYTRLCIPERDRDKAILFTDVATEVLPVDGAAGLARDARRKDGPTEFITVGRLDAWRGFDLCIEALAEVVKVNRAVHLSIVGKGADRPRLEALIRRLGVEDYVTLTGALPMEAYRERMRQADVVVNAALKEGAVTVSFDAMALGKPLLCVDTTGYTRYFRNDFSVVIPRVGRQEVIVGLTRGMLRLTDADVRRGLGDRARTAAQEISWTHHGEEIRDAILGALRKEGRR
jgi:glycosyltransferase involved in cell wall biosynthesis